LPRRSTRMGFGLRGGKAKFGESNKPPGDLVQVAFGSGG
jgi:hypothetical protein